MKLLRVFSFVILLSINQNVQAFFGSLFGGESTTNSISYDEENASIFKFPYSAPQFIYDEERIPWVASSYENQDTKLGYKNFAFKVPKGLETRVAFWKKIYTQYSSWQGVIHHPEYPEIVYMELDFSDIEQRMDLNIYQKRRERKKRIKAAKNKVKAALLKLARKNNIRPLKALEQKIFDMYTKHSLESEFFVSARRSNIRFQLGQRNFIIKGIYDSGRYLNRMENIFNEQELPLELTRLPFVESSFNLRARSKVGASGIWQFMRSTAKQYMKVNRAIDQRNDPLIATKAAAKKLRNNYNKLGNWPLALTAYNYGPSGLYRLSKKYKTDNLVELINIAKSRRFGFASKNFYASFLALLEVEKKANYYLGKVFRRPELQFEEIKLPKRISYKFLKKYFVTEKELFEYNPHFTRYVRKNYISIPKNTFVRLPLEKSGAFISSLSKIKKIKLANGLFNYGVERGDTLSDISAKFGVSVVKLMEVNNLSGPNRIYIGQKLLIPKN